MRRIAVLVAVILLIPAGGAAAAVAVPPGTPAALSATPGSRTVKVSWLAPVDGGAAISDYLVQYRRKGYSTWKVFRDGVSADTHTHVSGLLNGVVYQFRVAAKNTVGTGPWSKVAERRAGVPTETLSVVPTAGSRQVQLSWQKPVSTSGASITDYVIQYRRLGNTTWATFADGWSTSRHTHVTRLTNGVTYQFRVAARNARGVGAWSKVVRAQPSSTSSSVTVPVGGVWSPGPGTSWQWQLSGSVDVSVDAQMFDVDLFETSVATVAELKSRGRAVVCYMSAGAWEEFRPDAGVFPASVLGASNGWAGERWLDIRRLDVLGPIMEARLDLCRDKGFVGVEVDNIDGYSNNTGFALTAADQLVFNKFLAAAAHARGLSIGLKNDVEQAAVLEPFFDWAINEECAAYDECELLLPFIEAGKAVFHVEYDLETSQFCPLTVGLGFSSMRKNLDLDAWRQYCPTS
jgi:endo-alpha-1,4-polygalactosaminidase (GH114 family)